MKRNLLTALAVSLLLSSCSLDYLEVNFPEDPSTLPPSTITVLFGDEDADDEDVDTRTSFTYKNDVLTAKWATYDELSVVPDGYMGSAAGVYFLDWGHTSSSQFEMKTAPGVAATGKYAVFYPSTVKSYAQFINFKYTGQSQKKGSKTHMGKYHVMMKDGVEDYSVLDMTDAVSSSCYHFNLSGMTFKSPYQLELSISNTMLPVTNSITFVPKTESGDPIAPAADVEVLSMGLTGYTDTESSIEAWMMASNRNVTIPAGSTIYVTVTCTDGTFQAEIPVAEKTVFQGGRCHELTVDSGWKKVEASNPDGEVVVLQQGTKSGLDIVIVGDGFLLKEVKDGTYDKVMRQAYSDFFSVQPFTYFKDWFSVYYVKAVSNEKINAVPLTNGANQTASDTKFSVKFTANSTGMSGNDSMVRSYAQKAIGSSRMGNATMLVIADLATHAGTCFISYSPLGGDYCQGSSIAYFPTGRSLTSREQLLHHEANGHGFGKLADEYGAGRTAGFLQSTWTDLAARHVYGMYRNADKYDDGVCSITTGVKTTKDNVYWKDMFGTVNNYESSSVESLGVFQGGKTRSDDVCRPTENAYQSIMNQNQTRFNAVCRRQIFYRIRCLAKQNVGKWGDAAEYKAFLDWDAEVCLPSIRKAAQNAPARRNCVEQQYEELMPLAPPVLIEITDEDL